MEMKMLNEKCFAMRTLRGGRVKCGCCEGKCPGHIMCPFYKPVWKYERDLRLKYARLAALPETTQMHIAYKYYRGMMPWRGDIV